MVEFNGTDVIIMTCSDCNTDCKHCYIGYSGNYSANDLYNLCLKLKEKYHIFLNGTEILLHEEYFETIKLIKQNYLLTNGLKLYKNEILMQKLSDIGIKHIDMSYHFGIHDDISKVKFQIIEDNVKRLLKYNIRSEIRTTISSKNYKLLESIVDKVYEIGAEGIKFTNYMQLGNAMNLDYNNMMKDDELNQFFKYLNNARNKYDINKFRIRRCGSFERDLTKEHDNFECVAGTKSVAITPDLKVYPCFFLTSPGYEIGYVDDGKILIDSEFKNDGEKCLTRKIVRGGK